MYNIHRGYIDIRTSFNGFSHDIESPSIADGLFANVTLFIRQWFAIIGALSQVFLFL